MHCVRDDASETLPPSLYSYKYEGNGPKTAGGKQTGGGPWVGSRQGRAGAGWEQRELLVPRGGMEGVG